MTTGSLDLAEGFPPADAERWRALVDKTLAGAPFERLRAQLYDGISIEPVYTAADAPPGAVLGRAGPWDIRQVCAQEDAAKANADILADLEGGATSIELYLHNEKMETAEFLAVALDGVMLDLAPVAIEPFSLESVEALAQFAARRGAKQASLAFNMSLLHGYGPIARDLAPDFPNAALFRVDTRWVHEQGGSPTQELASAMAHAAYSLRIAETFGFSAQDFAARSVFSFSVGADLIVEMAKLRAARLLWTNMLRACGADAPMRIQAYSGRRMMTTLDAWTNMLRVTTAAFAAAAGGADIITTAPMTEAIGMPTSLARRIARNTQILIQEEAHVANVRDPGAGSWAVEKLTDDLARAAWALFQGYEACAPVGAERDDDAQRANWSAMQIQAVEATAQKRAKDIRARKQPIIGVSEHPILGASEPQVKSADRDWQGALVVEERASEPFERLRVNALKHAPKIFLATLGAPAQFSAREGFARGLFEAGGIKAVGGEIAHDPQTLGAAFKASGAQAACLCGADAVYAAQAEAAARVLKDAGCTYVALAGKPGEHEAAWRAAGVDAFAFAGMDAVTFLEETQRALGIAP